MDAIATRTITRKLTESEMVNTAKTLAKTMSERERILIEKKSAVDEFKARIEEKEEFILQLQHSVNSGTTDEKITCIVRKNYADRVKEYIYEGEIVDTEPMSDSEMQLGFD